MKRDVRTSKKKKKAGGGGVTLSGQLVLGANARVVYGSIRGKSEIQKTVASAFVSSECCELAVGWCGGGRWWGRGGGYIYST